MNVFIDTNVLLDVLGKREPFYSDSARVWTLAESGQVAGFISTVSLPNLFYLFGQTHGPKAARELISLVRDTFSLVALDAQITCQSLDANMEDFEDAIQFFSALRAGANALITRNVKDFPLGDLVVETPTQFLATHFPA